MQRTYFASNDPLDLMKTLEGTEILWIRCQSYIRNWQIFFFQEWTHLALHSFLYTEFCHFYS